MWLITMKQIEETASTMDVVGVEVADKEEVTRPAPSPTSTTIEGGGGVTQKKVFVTEEQFMSVFSNSLVITNDTLVELA